MEPNELDKLFRDVIHNDASELSPKEKKSKSEIWEQLDLPNKDTAVSFPFWKIAAGILFLLLGGSIGIMLNNLNQQKTKFAQLEQDFQAVKNELFEVEQKLATTEKLMNASQSETIPTELIPTTNTIIEKELVDRIVSVRDTVWVEKIVSAKEKIRLVRDTVFVEVPAKSPARWTSHETKTPVKKDSIQQKKRPSKVEFVFGKKEMKKPVQKESIFLWKTDVAKKTKKKKRKNAIFSIPDNN